MMDPSKPEQYARLFHDAVPGARSAQRAGEAPLRGVVHAWSLDAAPADAATPETTLADVRRGTFDRLFLVQAMSRTASATRPGSSS